MQRQPRPTPEERLQSTMPSRAVRVPVYRQQRPYPAPPAPRHYSQPTQKANPGYPAAPMRPKAVQSSASLPQRQPQPRSKIWIIAPLIGLTLMLIATCSAVTFGAALIYGQGILPGVSAAGVDLSGLSEAEAQQQLAANWNSITLRDGDRIWAFAPSELGIELDAAATAHTAYEQGRSQSNPIQAIFSDVDVAPAINVNINQAAAAFANLTDEFTLPAINAGVELVGGEVRATPSKDGRALNMSALMDVLQNRADTALADGTLELPMLRLAPDVIDATSMVEMARALLANPLRIMTYDPIDNINDEWRIAPQDWSQWLTATAAANSPSGLALSLQAAPISAYLNQQNASLSGSRGININEGVQALQTAIARNQTDVTLRVYHDDIQHTVQPGETIISIAWDYGVPYPWVQQANPGIGDNVSVGQSITIPSADNFLEFPPVVNKRIVVSISQQRTQVFENGQLKWDWVSSTGISDSPTWPGIYQVILHDPDAYAANWNLNMPWFMGVYRPIPGAAFTNGFHGFPTRGGSQLLWTNNLGTRVTYGCILLSSDNARLLYDWAEEGVVVEIRA